MANLKSVTKIVEETCIYKDTSGNVCGIISAGWNFCRKHHGTDQSIRHIVYSSDGRFGYIDFDYEDRKKREDLQKERQASMWEKSSL